MRSHQSQDRILWAARFIVRTLARCLCLFALLSLMTEPVMADVQSSMQGFFNDAGVAANVTGPNAFQGQSAGYYALGNLYARFPQKNVAPFNVQLPSVRAGCGGIDLFAGSFSFINSAQLVALMKSIANNAVGFAFQLALKSISPQIESAMADLRQAANLLNNSNISSCETAQALVGGVWPQSAATSSIICKAIGNHDGLFDDWAAAQQGCANGGQSQSTIDSAKDPALKAQNTVSDNNFTWQILNSSPEFQNFDQQTKEMFMTIFGTIITRKATGEGDTQAAQIKIIAPSKDDVIQALLDGTDQGGTIKILQCDDAIACLSPDYTQNMSITAGSAYRLRVLKSLQQIQADVQQHLKPASPELALISMSSIPIYKIIRTSVVAHNSLSSTELDTFAEIISTQILGDVLEHIVEQFAHATNNLQSADQINTKTWIDQVEKTRTSLSQDKNNLIQRLMATYAIISRSSAMEATMQNAINPQLAASLNFSRNIGAQ